MNLRTAGRWRALLCAILLPATLLVACATRPADIASMPWTSGRLSLQIAASAAEGARSVTASFDLRGDADRGELRLSSPLGSLVAAAQWSPGRAVLETPQGQQQFSDLEALSREALGEPLPLQALPDWLSGKPWAGAISQPREGGFEQLGWRVAINRFTDGFIDAERDAAPAVKLRVRLDR